MATIQNHRKLLEIVRFPNGNLSIGKPSGNDRKAAGKAEGSKKKRKGANGDTKSQTHHLITYGNDEKQWKIIDRHRISNRKT